MMRRLYAKLYLAFVAVVLSCFLAAAWAASRFGEARDIERHFASLAELFVESLPPPSDPAFTEAMRRHARRLSVEIALWEAGGSLLGFTGNGPPPARMPAPGWFHLHGEGGVAVRLSDGRILAARRVGGPSRHGQFLLALATFAAMLAVGCYPIARRITRRLESLQTGMHRFAAGDLGARAPVEGNDEVAAVARSFNDAASRVEELVERQRGLLATASHELRSPLARVRMAVELLVGEDSAERARLATEAARDIEELDALIGDLLESARTQAPVRGMEPVDLRALLAIEAQRFGAESIGQAEVVGDRRMLVRLIRNLFENARLHAGGRDVRATLSARENEVTLTVEDGGPGVPEAERERIFEPFYRPAGPAAAAGDDRGVGLGLSLVRQIARYHGGDATYQPRESGGSRFVVRILSRPRGGSSGLDGLPS